jgi:periplasmic protein TonB
MLDRRLGSVSSPPSDGESWLERVRENLAQLLAPVRFTHSSANGAPIHLLATKRTARAGQAQSFSLLVHIAVIGSLLYFAARPRVITSDHPAVTLCPGCTLTLPPGFLRPVTGNNPSPGKNGGSGNKEPYPTTRGVLAPLSSISLVHPHKPLNQDPKLTVNASILDPESPALLNPPYVKLGLPWMKNDTSAAGPGCCDGFGSADGHRGMGDGKGDDGAGFGKKGIYTPGMKMPSCSYCPDPPYTEEARKAKIQGNVMLEVLIGANGQALKLRISSGIGFGLDERAMQTVQTWRFIPARDASGRTVPMWVPVEVTFRLF